MEEEWRQIPEFEGLYEVSNTGKIRSLARIVNSCYGSKMALQSKEIKLNLKRNGYMYVCLSKEGSANTYRVHRLVALAFISNPNNQPQVNHKNGVKNDNRVGNLEWCTASQNSNHAYSSNLRFSPSYWKDKSGSEHNLSKPVVMMTQQDETVRMFGSSYEAERETQIANQNISKCLKGKRKTAGGYKWKYHES